MNGYDLSRTFVDFGFENPSIIKPNHYAVYFFAIEHCNRLGWKKEFGLPTTMAMEAIGIKSYNTYIKTFNELIDFGFFEIVERSKNQFSSNIIKLSKNDKALDKALDKAFIKHASKQSESADESIDSINKPINNETSKPITQNEFDFIDKYIIEIGNTNGHDQWKDSFYMNYKLKNGSLSKMLLNFKTAQILLSTMKDKGINEFKIHFFNWMNIQERNGLLTDFKKK